MTDAGEMSFKPHPLSIVLRRFFLLCVLLAYAVFVPDLMAMLSFRGLGVGWYWLPLLGLLTWEILVWASRRYVITPEVYESREGVLQRLIARVERSRLQQVTVTKLVRERIFGLGTVQISSASDSVPTVLWAMIADPERRADQARSSVAAPPNVPAAPAPRARRPFVLGIVGGIGSGKSAFAKALGRHGARVIESDLEARRALQLPEVVARLREWWGNEVVGEGGEPDRAKVAAIVFASEEERRRLEGLVHPIIKRRREAFIEQAARDGVDVVAVDAPLLFEAGVDRECDAVAFVDASRDVRVARVRSSRGWSEEELDKREGAQMPHEEKKGRSRYVVDNNGAEQDLDRQALALLSSIRSSRGPGAGGVAGG